MNTVTYAPRVTRSEARRHFEAGGAVAVSERGHLERLPLGPTSTTYTRETTTWLALVALVTERKGRYPNQRFYNVPNVTEGEGR